MLCFYLGFEDYNVIRGRPGSNSSSSQRVRHRPPVTPNTHRNNARANSGPVHMEFASRSATAITPATLNNSRLYRVNSLPDLTPREEPISASVGFKEHVSIAASFMWLYISIDLNRSFFISYRIVIKKLINFYATRSVLKVQAINLITLLRSISKGPDFLHNISIMFVHFNS